MAPSPLRPNIPPPQLIGHPHNLFLSQALTRPDPFLAHHGRVCPRMTAQVCKMVQEEQVVEAAVGIQHNRHHPRHLGCARKTCSAAHLPVPVHVLRPTSKSLCRRRAAEVGIPLLSPTLPTLPITTTGTIAR